MEFQTDFENLHQNILFGGGYFQGDVKIMIRAGCHLLSLHESLGLGLLLGIVGSRLPGLLVLGPRLRGDRVLLVLRPPAGPGQERGS